MRGLCEPVMTRYRKRVTKTTPAVDTLTYEQARDELIEIVGKLEAGASTLDESMTLWDRGEALAARCEALLDGAQVAIEAATRGRDDA